MSNIEELEKLAVLRTKGVISEAEFETQKKFLLSEDEREKKTYFPEMTKERILFAIVLLGVFSVLAGLGLIIAANWASIPSMLKVALGLGSLASSLVATTIFEKNGKSRWKEVFLFISFLLVGGNIALIQQVYHLSLSWSYGSFLWWLLSMPLIFFSKNRLLPICSVGLLIFSGWDIIWNMNYMLVAGVLFLFMMLTHFSTGKTAKMLRDLAFVAAIFALFAGDILSRSGAHIVGVISTTIFLIVALSQPKTPSGVIRYYNYLFIFVAWRIFLLFWNAYYNLTNIGILLIVFGVILLTGVGLYTYFFQQIQNIIKRFVEHD